MKHATTFGLHAVRIAFGARRQLGMGDPGRRPVQEGATSVRWAIDLPDRGPTGGF